MANIPIIGADAAGEAKVRGLLAAMAPSAVPFNGIVFLPRQKYQELRNGVQNGNFGGQAIANRSGDEQFGTRNSTNIGDGFSIVSAGRTYMNADLLQDDKQLSKILAHELGHYHAAAVGGPQSEQTADKQRDVYLQRAQQAQKIDAGLSQLPPSARGILSGALRGLQAQPQSPLANLAENNIK